MSGVSSPRPRLPLLLLVLWLPLIGPAGCRSDRERPLTIYCAASTLAVVEEIAALSPAAVAVHGASSSTLARQIESGAPADIFISVHPGWVAHLAERGRLDPAEARVMGHNSLVIAAREDGPTQVPTLPTRFSTGDPAHVPLGIFAAQALRARGDWESWRERLLPAADARAAVEYLRRGEAEVAILYRTDALAEPELRILEELPIEWHEPIELIATHLRGALPGAVELHRFLGSIDARARLGAAGFRPGLAPRREEP